MSYKIGETFDFESTKLEVKVAPTCNSCKECYFHTLIESDDNIDIFCTMPYRANDEMSCAYGEDYTDIIFVEVKGDN